MEETSVAFFRNSLREARKLFDAKSTEQKELESRLYWLKDDLAKLRRTVTALAVMCSEEPWADPLGITESCMEVMDVVKGEQSTQAVVRKLEAMGFDLASQKNPAASVHSVLSRLAHNGKIQKITDDSDSKKVTWRGPNYDPAYDDYAQSAEISDDDIPF